MSLGPWSGDGCFWVGGQAACPTPPSGPMHLRDHCAVPLLTPSWAVPLRAQPQLDQSLYHHVEVPESCPFCVQVPTHSNLGDAVLGLDLHFWSSQISVLLILLLNGKNQQQGQCLGHWAATGTRCSGYRGRPPWTCDGDALNAAYCSVQPEPRSRLINQSTAFHMHENLQCGHTNGVLLKGRRWMCLDE